MFSQNEINRFVARAKEITNELNANGVIPLDKVVEIQANIMIALINNDTFKSISKSLNEIAGAIEQSSR